MSPFRNGQDGAAGVVGTILLVGITVVLGVAATIVAGTLRTPEPQIDAGVSSSFSEDGYHLVLTGPNGIPLDQGGQIFATIDGVDHVVGLEQLSAQLPDPAIWSVGQSICISGAPPCLFPTGGAVGVTVALPNQIVFTLSPIEYKAAPESDSSGPADSPDISLTGDGEPSFLIQSDDGVRAQCETTGSVRIVGTQITQGPGGPSIPVTVALTTNGTAPFMPLFSDQRVDSGMVHQLPQLAPGAVVGIKASANRGNFHATYDSVSSSPQVIVLKDGDAAPDYAPYGDQESLASFMQPYVDTEAGTMTLGPSESILLFELGTTDLDSAAADFQDLVVLFHFETAEC